MSYIKLEQKYQSKKMDEIITDCNFIKISENNINKYINLKIFYKTISTKHF